MTRTDRKVVIYSIFKKRAPHSSILKVGDPFKKAEHKSDSVEPCRVGKWDGGGGLRGRSGGWVDGMEWVRGVEGLGVERGGVVGGEIPWLIF